MGFKSRFGVLKTGSFDFFCIQTAVRACALYPEMRDESLSLRRATIPESSEYLWCVMMDEGLMQSLV